MQSEISKHQLSQKLQQKKREYEQLEQEYLDSVAEEENTQHRQINDALNRLCKRLAEAPKPEKNVSEQYYMFLLYPHEQGYYEMHAGGLELNDDQTLTYSEYKGFSRNSMPCYRYVANRQDVEPDEADKALFKQHGVRYRIIMCGPKAKEFKKQLQTILGQVQNLERSLNNVTNYYFDQQSIFDTDYHYYDRLAVPENDEQGLVVVKKRLQEIEENIESFKRTRFSVNNDTE